MDIKKIIEKTLEYYNEFFNEFGESIDESLGWLIESVDEITESYMVLRICNPGFKLFTNCFEITGIEVVKIHYIVKVSVIDSTCTFEVLSRNVERVHGYNNPPF